MRKPDKFTVIKNLKRTLGLLIIAQVLPLVCIAINTAEIHKHPIYVPYLSGYLCDAIVVALIGLGLLVVWCFED